MVVTSAPSTAWIGVMQDRVGRPPTWTVQAPHIPIPQPNFVPLSPISSRSTQSRGVSASSSVLTGLPLTEKRVVMSLHPLALCAELRDGLLQVGPWRLIGACAPEIGGEPSDIGIAEPF